MSTEFFVNLPIKAITVKGGKISDLLIVKINYVIRKVIKKLHITHYYCYFDF